MEDFAENPFYRKWAVRFELFELDWELKARVRNEILQGPDLSIVQCADDPPVFPCPDLSVVQHLASGGKFHSNPI